MTKALERRRWKECFGGLPHRRNLFVELTLETLGKYSATLWLMVNLISLSSLTETMGCIWLPGYSLLNHPVLNKWLNICFIILNIFRPVE